MNNTIKTLLLLIILLLFATLIGVGARTWLSDQRQNNNGTNEIDTALSPDIPEELSAVAEIEYAIEFETAEPELNINLQFCNFVKSKCEEQGISNCEDYKMCLKGIKK
jgi:hypothetical protein